MAKLGKTLYGIRIQNIVHIGIIRELLDLLEKVCII
jgi:hypothetical protein